MRQPGRARSRKQAEPPRPADAPRGPSFILSDVDAPRPGERLQPGGILAGKGWAISESPIASIAVHLGDQFLCYASYGQPRPEIGRDFSHYPQAHHAGFVFSVRLGPETEQAHGADLRFRFRTEDGSEASRYVPLAWSAADAAAEDDAANRPWPIRLALEECRVDPAGRLRLRGWAIARRDLTSLDLYLNETLLHPPERGLDRPDIAQRHPAYPGAAASGFRLVQHLDQPPGERDTVRVVARAGAVQRQIIVPLAAPDMQRRLLQTDAVSLCCENLRLSPQGHLTVAGWAAGAAETREIEVFAGTQSLGLAETGLPRPDIGNRFPQLPGARFAGFRFRGPAPAATAALTLVVRDSEGGERRMDLHMPGAEAAPAGAATETIHAGIDRPLLRDGRATAPIHGLVSIAGWAVCASGIAEVEVWSDDTRLGRAYIGVRREEIGAAYPDLPDALTSGFALTVPHRLIGDGEHAIRVVIRARSGATTEELFRVVLETDDDRGVGGIRRSVPFAETALALDLLAQFGPPPSFTVLIRRASAAEPRGLAATLDSLRRQTLARWHAIVLVHDGGERDAAEALIAADPELAGRVTTQLATASASPWPGPPGAGLELLCLARAGDRFGADALMALAVEARLSGAPFVYADERCYDPARDSVRPFFKPSWSPDLLLSFNYVGRAWCATRALAEAAGIDGHSLDRFGEYDAVLRLTEAATAIAHLPLSLAERLGKRIEPKPREQEALARAATRRGIAAEVLPGLAPGAWRLRRAVPPDTLVSVIIPTCGTSGLIRTAIQSLRAHTAQPIEVVVLDDIPADQAELKVWVAAHADRTIPMSGAFNWSRANNLGARAATGAYLLFLNDDTECHDPGWLTALLEHAQRPEVGAVGPQLLYPDGKVQHAGMFLRGAEGLHGFRFTAADDPGAFGLALTQRDVTAVTGACLLTRRDVFERLGGFDERHSVIKNDLDYCLRLSEAGLRVIYTPHASLTHHEMASRAPLPDSYDAPRFDSAWAIRQLQGDRLINPNLSRESEDYLAETEPVRLQRPGPPLLDASRVRTILVLKLDHIGDFICALPAIEHLRASFPRARITLLAAEASLALAALSPAIDETIRFDFFAADPAAGKRQIGEAEFDALAASLRPRHFDIAVDLRTHGDTRHVLRYTGATLLAGYDHGGRFPWLDIKLEWEGDLRLTAKHSHIAETLLRLASAIGQAAAPIPASLTLPQAEAAAARARLAAAAPPGFTSRPLVAIHPGAGTPLKQWPAAAFAGLIRLLLDSHDLSIVLIGTAAETAIVAETARLAGRPDAVLPLAGAVPLADLPALLQGCALFVGDDSGPKHIAAALGVPTVGIHAAHVEPAEWGPLGPRAVAISREMSCGPCYISDEADCPRNVTCLRGISPAQVYRACRLLLGFTFGAAGSGAGGGASGSVATVTDGAATAAA